MEDHCNPLTLCCFYQEQEIAELRDLREALTYTTMELETTILSAKVEISRREDELVHLKDVLFKTLKERDEAQRICQNLILQKHLLQQETQQTQQDPSKNSSTESDNSRGSEIITAPIAEQTSGEEEQELEIEVKKPLPEKGKLLKAVMEAGPLLQILLLAGQLPEWQHPPPQVQSIEIPLMSSSSPTTPFKRQDSSKSVTSGTCLSKKRPLEFHGSPTSSKTVKIVDSLHLDVPLTASQGLNSFIL